ncbi:hypothetical protein [Mangrovibacterium diazotrophicum]|uniref:Carboxypeptidase-like protein n=1 Tax=Mangrovibacterium diazotrophicum TaxID=1261403 RepID=A0A419VUZ1_9BACT|nr:hypothetical protein [Mangrovibacterium diazotrophicum]RKD85173.1 hypothetical protein BC643_4692 [Mangrovibacterium diazotrophicum]
MKRLVLILITLLSINAIAYCQNTTSQSFVYDGYVYSQDSLPLEGAFLINYRTSKIVATDHSGYFKMAVEAGDSLMVNHVSMAPKVVNVVPTYLNKAHIYVTYRTYMVNPITTYDEEKQRSNLEQSMDQLNQDIKEQILVDPTKRTGNENTYDEDVQNPGATIIRVTPNISKKDKKD